MHDLVGRLADTSFLAVLGPSGSGKSSLVLAGIIPTLQDRMPDLAWTVFAPGDNPSLYLQSGVEKLGLANPSPGLTAPAGAAILVVDQFEELFTQTPAARRAEFITSLLTLAKSQDRRVKVIITMRADFWGDCANYPQLADLMQVHQELIGPMSSPELRSAMEQQAGVVGLRFEADLANTLVDDVQAEPGAMPLLSMPCSSCGDGATGSGSGPRSTGPSGGARRDRRDSQ